MDFVSAEHYAKHLATYISSPLKIEGLVRLDWEDVPPLHQIAEWRYQHEQAGRANHLGTTGRYRTEGAANDHLHWQPKTFVKRERARDYIDVSGTRPVRFVLPAIPDNAPAHLGVANRLIASVAADFDVQPAEMKGQGRTQLLFHARAVVIRLLTERGFSSTQIGRRLNRDHTSILHARRQFDIYERISPVVRASYERHSLMMREAA